MWLHSLTPEEINEKIILLPETLQRDVGDSIVPTAYGVKLPWFENGIRWNDEFNWSPHCIGEALSTYWDQLTQISQWKELQEYAKSKGFSNLSSFFQLANMDSWRWNKWQNWDAYLVRKDPNILTTRFWFKQWVSSILASSSANPYLAYSGWRGMAASKKGLYKIRLQNTKAED